VKGEKDRVCPAERGGTLFNRWKVDQASGGRKGVRGGVGLRSGARGEGCKTGGTARLGGNAFAPLFFPASMDHNQGRRDRLNAASGEDRPKNFTLQNWCNNKGGETTSWVFRVTPDRSLCCKFTYYSRVIDCAGSPKTPVALGGSV